MSPAPDIKPGDHVRTLHDCRIDGSVVRHEAHVTIDEVTRTILGVRYRGVRCDGSPIEWVER